MLANASSQYFCILSVNLKKTIILSKTLQIASNTRGHRTINSLAETLKLRRQIAEQVLVSFRRFGDSNSSG